MRHAMTAKNGAARTRAIVAPTRSTERLISREEGLENHGWKAQERKTLEGMDADLGADHLEESRDNVDLNLEVPKRTDQRDRLLESVM